MRPASARGAYTGSSRDASCEWKGHETPIAQGMRPASGSGVE